MAAELAASNLNADSHLLLDQPLLKVPIELLRKTHKSAQRNVERERDSLLSALKAAAAKDACSTPDGTAEALSSIDSMITRMETLKRKLSGLNADEKLLHKQSKARIGHVQELHNIPSVADVAYESWSKVRLSRLLVDYLLRSGYEQSARSLAQASGTIDLVDVNEFVATRRVERSLLNSRTAECLAWCAENKAALKKLSSNLEVEVRLQEYIELLRTREVPNMLKATKHAQKYLTPHGDTDSSIRAAGLLAFPPNTLVEPYRSLYAPERWKRLAELFMKTHHNLLGLPHDPPLYIALTAGLSALKTPCCHSSHVSPSSALNANTATPNSTATLDKTTQASGEEEELLNIAPRPAVSAIGHSVCPICSTELNTLARAVPYAHQTRSIVDSDLVVLPNGRVYGREKLMAFQAKVSNGAAVGEEAADGMEGVESAALRDPADPEQTFEIGRLKKVYIS